MPCTILIVDDAEPCIATLEITLAPLSGVVVRTASNARDALQILQDNSSQINLLITDLNLRPMDGFEMIERVRRQPDLATLPIIVISGDPDPRTPERLVKLGVNIHIRKPYSPAEVRQALEEFVNACT